MKKSLTLSLVTLLAALGCSSGPSAVEPPDIDAGDAASQAMELYDKDGDGAIAGSELDAVPAFKASMKNLDKSGDGSVQEDEIAARIESWQNSGDGIVALAWSVTLDGRPVEGAKITFEPEPFLGDQIKAAEGETSPVGMSTVSIPKANRPAPDSPPGVQLGFYKIRVSKQAGGKETIPARYNTETTLGQEVAPDDPAIAGQKLRIELSSK
jgi:hypothetical protein